MFCLDHIAVLNLQVNTHPCSHIAVLSVRLELISQVIETEQSRFFFLFRFYPAVYCTPHSFFALFLQISKFKFVFRRAVFQLSSGS